MKNLLKETKAVLKEHGKSFDDVAWIWCEEYQIPVASFMSLADQEYNDGYGSPKVATNLVVVGKGFWLERAEYDGSEWWEYKEPIPMPIETRGVKSLFASAEDVGWVTLQEVNGERPWQ